MFELNRLKTVLSYDFVTMAAFMAINVPESESHLTLEQSKALLLSRLKDYWGVDVTYEDVHNAVLLVGRGTFQLPDPPPPAVAKFLDCINSIATENAPNYPPAYLKIVQDFLAREIRVCEIYGDLEALFQGFINVGGWDVKRQAELALTEEIDGSAAEDVGTKALVSALLEFCVESDVNPGHYFFPKDQVLFPNSNLIPWFVHPEDPKCLGVSTLRGLLWLTTKPEGLRSWRDIVNAAVLKEMEVATAEFGKPQLTVC